MTKSGLVRLAESLGADALDQLVHDCYAEMASKLNNEGAEAIIDNLLDLGYSMERIEEIVRDTIKAESCELDTMH